MARTNANRKLWTALRAHDVPGALAALAGGANPRVQSGRRLPLAYAMEHADLMAVAAHLVQLDPQGATDLVCQMMANPSHPLASAREVVLVSAKEAGVARHALLRAALAGGREDWARRLWSPGLADMGRSNVKPVLCEWSADSPPAWLCAAFLDAQGSCPEAENALVAFALALNLPPEKNILAQQMCARPHWLSRHAVDNGARLVGGALARGQKSLALAALQALPVAPDHRRQGWILGKFMRQPVHALDEDLRKAFVARGFVATTSTIQHDAHVGMPAQLEIDALLLALSWGLPPNTKPEMARQQLDADIANIQWHHARGGRLEARFPIALNRLPAQQGLVDILMNRYASWPRLQGMALSWLLDAHPHLLSTPGVGLSIAACVRNPDDLLPLLDRVPACAHLAGIPILEELWRRRAEFPPDSVNDQLVQVCAILVRKHGVDPFQVHDGEAFMSHRLPLRMREQLCQADADRMHALLEAGTAATQGVRPLRRL